MNFSNTKKLSKILSLILVLAMTAAMFTGCFGGKEDNEETQPNININLSETTTPPETQTEPVVTEPTEINENMATILSELTVRSSPSMDATNVSTLYAGDRVEILQQHHVLGTTWGYITSPKTGWICMDYVEMDVPSEVPVGGSTETPAGATAPTEAEQDEPSGTATNFKGVVTTGLNIRREANTTSTIVGNYNNGDVVTILETKNGWGRTDKGWIKLDYVKTNSTTNTNTNTSNTGNTDKDDDTTVNITSNGSTTVQFRGIVTATDLNIRASASQNAERVGGYEYGDRVEILEQDGNWGRTSKGWISLSYVYEDGTSTGESVTGTVTVDGLNIRSGPGKTYGVLGSYNEGDDVTILARFTYSGTTWGCTKTGWISMNYVDLDDEYEDDDEVVEDSDDDDAVTGYITADGLRIRSGPGTDYATVGSLEYGDEVTITDQVEDGNDVTWGKISSGWISMDYVELD